MDFFDILKAGTVLGKKKRVHATGSPIGVSLRKIAPTEAAESSKTLHEIESFDDIPALQAWLSSGLSSAGFLSPTEIQKRALPVMVSGVDCIATASTGSGKTVAYIVPILVLLQKPAKDFARALVIAPTRELVQQISREAENLISHCSKNFRVRVIDNIAENVKRVDIAVGTPLRIVQLLSEGLISLRETKIAVLDEADRLLDLGFGQQVDEIISVCMKERDVARRSFQICFFSATLPPKIVELAKSAMIDPVTISVGPVGAPSKHIIQKLVYTGSEEGKILSFKQLVINGEILPPALIFVNSKEKAQQLCAELVMRGILADSIHAGRTKHERDRSVQAFREGKIWVLVTTELLARGIDFKAVDMVINFDIPTTTVNYIHRIGRTGRAGRIGQAVTFFTDEDASHVKRISNVIRNSGQEVPDWISALPRRPTQKRLRVQKPIHRKSKTSSHS